MGENKIDEEGVRTILNDQEELIGIIRRDPVSGKHLIYIVTEAKGDDIAALIGSKIIRSHEAQKDE